MKTITKHFFLLFEVKIFFVSRFHAREKCSVWFFHRGHEFITTVVCYHGQSMKVQGNVHYNSSENFMV